MPIDTVGATSVKEIDAALKLRSYQAERFTVMSRFFVLWANKPPAASRTALRIVRVFISP